MKICLTLGRSARHTIDGRLCLVDHVGERAVTFTTGKSAVCWLLEKVLLRLLLGNNPLVCAMGESAVTLCYSVECCSVCYREKEHSHLL